jgi:hypothetical protein
VEVPLATGDPSAELTLAAVSKVQASVGGAANAGTAAVGTVNATRASMRSVECTEKPPL